MIPTPHINAGINDFAETVLMPGDPLRAKFIAEHFLTDCKCVTSVRNCLGYTGYYKNKRISIMSSGMGQPSMGIYSYELFNFYNVKNIIRIGSCGSLCKDLHIKDIVLAMGACTDGNFQKTFLNTNGSFAPIASFKLLKAACDKCEQYNVNYKVGNILSTDIFYGDKQQTLDWNKYGVLAVEMETLSLYCNAAMAHKNALTICTVSDSLATDETQMTSKEREQSLTNMISIALDVAIEL